MSIKLYNDMAITSFTFIIVAFIGVVSGILFPRFLGPEQFGLWSITSSVIGLLGPIAQVAMSTALVTYISKYSKNQQKVSSYCTSAFLIAIINSFVISILLLVFSGYLADLFFKDDRLTFFFIIASSLIFFGQLNIMNFDYFRGLKDFKKYNILQIVPEILILIITLTLFIIFSNEAIYVVISRAIITFIIAIITLIFILKIKPTFKLFKKPQKEETIKLLKFGIPLIFAASFLLIMKSIDKIFLGYFFDMSVVGIYTVATTIPFIIGSMFIPISTVLLPTISERNLQGISSENLLKELFSILLFISIPIIIFITLFSKNILIIIFGNSYIDGSSVFVIASFEIFLYGGYALFRTSLEAKEKTSSLAVSYGFAALINIILNIILIPFLGMNGAAIGTVISFALLFIFVIYLTKKNYNFSFGKNNFKIALLLSFSLTIIGYLSIMIFDSILSLVISSISFLIIGFAIAQYYNPLWFNEMKRYFKKIITR